jgi:hypothetical protein
VAFLGRLVAIRRHFAREAELQKNVDVFRAGNAAAEFVGFAK